MSHSQIQFQKYEISRHYFEKCSELSVIERPFNYNSIAQQITRDLEAEFELLRALTETKKQKLKLRVNTILQNKKNRYPEQSIYEHSRVRLQEEGEGYINANWVPLPQGRRLIIAQAPLESTQQQFQQMISENKIECVVMLCNVLQNGKVRCFDYTENRQKESNQGEEGSLTISKVTFPQGEYVHIHYSGWPDRSVPQDNGEIESLLVELMKYERIAIHCSAGLGRSGVVAVLLAVLLQLRQSDEISIFGSALRLREHRFGAIQNSEQYAYIYHYLKFMNSD